MTRRITVIGGGAWGAAIASILQKSHEVSCLVRGQDTARALAQCRVPRLPAITLPHPLSATTDASSLQEADIIYLVVPASATEEALSLITQHAAETCPVILCAKGLIEDGPKGALFLNEYMRQNHADRPYGLLSGPSFADEVIDGLPAALVAASDDPALTQQMCDDFADSSVRLYHGSDPIGIAIGGAVKNVIALASGICTGLALGDNARAALITRGVAETNRLVQALGGHAETMSGLAGIGDLVLSAAGPHSRNMAYGLALGAGTTIPDALSEGARTAPLLAQRAQYEQVDMPLTQAVAKALTGAALQPIITDLLARPTVQE